MKRRSISISRKTAVFSTLKEPVGEGEQRRSFRKRGGDSPSECFMF